MIYCSRYRITNLKIFHWKITLKYMAMFEIYIVGCILRIKALVVWNKGILIKLINV